METLEKGKAYLFLGTPLWFRGVLEEETVFAFVLSAASAEYLPDANTIAEYVSGAVKGEMVKRRVHVPRDGAFVIEL